jgi:hypothetical protein
MSARWLLRSVVYVVVFFVQPLRGAEAAEMDVPSPRTTCRCQL